MNFWESIKNDLVHAYDEGREFAKKSGEAIAKSANNLTEEGKRLYSIFDLKIKARQHMTELGGTIYHISKTVKNPMLHPKVKAIKNKIAKIEKRITELHTGASKTERGSANKRSPKKTARPASNK